MVTAEERFHNTTPKVNNMAISVAVPKISTMVAETKRFKSTRTDGMEEMIEEGYKATIDAMPKIMEIFRKKKKHKIKNLPNDIMFIK